eukprot:augustus_masked-scaffold_3-processed-gene-7.52-mRNA-1 protein AED:0.22 eAED:1.00 QI:0/-1/0/1/-1/1/1/0/184
MDFGTEIDKIYKLKNEMDNLIKIKKFKKAVKVSFELEDCFEELAGKQTEVRSWIEDIANQDKNNLRGTLGPPPIPMPPIEPPPRIRTPEEDADFKTCTICMKRLHMNKFSNRQAMIVKRSKRKCIQCTLAAQPAPEPKAKQEKEIKFKSTADANVMNSSAIVETPCEPVARVVISKENRKRLLK